MKKQYSEEDFETDVAWLVGYGLDEQEAKGFILSLLDKERKF